MHAPPAAARDRTYGEILRLDELLTLQEAVTDGPDAHFFVVAHQIYELWFSVVLHELEHTRSAIGVDDLEAAAHRLTRVASIEDVLGAQVRTLETLRPAAFADIRSRLGNSSGFQSAQFREIEFLSGLKEPEYLEQVRVSRRERARLEQRLAEPSLRDALRALLARRGITDPVQLLCEDGQSDVRAVAERLLDHDAGFARWRSLHVLMVERLIGGKAGTGGSAGVHYLRSTRDKRFFPELWDARTRI